MRIAQLLLLGLGGAAASSEVARGVNAVSLEDPPQPNSFCYPRAFGPKANPLCLLWWREGKNFTFQVECTPDSFPFLNLTYCAIGFSALAGPDNDPPFYWRMFPSDIVLLQTTNAAGGKTGVQLTDRSATGSKLPPCMPTQVTHLLNASVDDEGFLSAFFTRPAILSDALLDQGYTNLNRSVATIAAISNQGTLPVAGCSSNIPPHDNEWWNSTQFIIDFTK